MSKQLDSVSVTFPRANSWQDDDDEFMQSVREDTTSKKFTKNTQPSAAWSKPVEVEKRSASVTGVQWSMPNLAARPAASPSSNGSTVRFDALSPTTRNVASWRGR